MKIKYLNIAILLVIVYINSFNSAFKINNNNNHLNYNNQLYIYSFTSNSELIVIDIKNNKLITNQSLSLPLYINNINNIKNNIYSLFVQNPNNRNCYLTEYDSTSNTFKNNGKSIKLRDKFEFLSQPYYNKDNIFYLPVQVDRFNKNVLSVLYWDFNQFKLGYITFKEVDYNTNYYPLGSLNSKSNQYYTLFFSNSSGSDYYPYIQAFNLKDNSSGKLYNFNNSFNGTNADSANLLLTTSNGITLIISNFINYISISSIDFNNSQIKSQATFEFGSYQNNFPAYFYNSNDDHLVIMDGVVDNSDYIIFKFIDLNTFKITQTYKSNNYYKDLSDGSVANLFYY